MAAAIGLAGVAGANAQVYSVNAVGYVNTALVQGFNMINNPLVPEDNLVSTLFADLPNGGIVYKYVDAGDGTFTWEANALQFGNWSVPTQTLDPGEGAFVNSPSPVTITFIGEVAQGDASNITIPGGLSVVSSATPRAGLLEDLGFPTASGDTVYRWNTAKTPPGYDAFSNFFGTWSPAAPEVAVGEAVFVQKAAEAAWNQDFDVNAAN